MAIARDLLRVLTRARRTLPLVQHVVPARTRRAIRHSLMARAVRDAPDRIFLERTIIPVLLTRDFHEVLSVGVEQYTAHHSGLFARSGVRLWTIDIDPYHARWGAPGRHVTGDVRELERYFGDATFDAVLFNGIIGFGIDDPESAEVAVASIAAVMRPRGWLVAGWDRGHDIDAVELTSTRTFFEPLSLGPVPARVTIDGTPHVYDHLVRNTYRRDAVA